MGELGFYGSHPLSKVIRIISEFVCAGGQSGHNFQLRTAFSVSAVQVGKTWKVRKKTSKLNECGCVVERNHRVVGGHAKPYRY